MILDLLKEEVAINYDREKERMFIWTDRNDAASLIRIVELLRGAFNVSEETIKINASNKGWRLRLEFPYNFDAASVSASEEDVDTSTLQWYSLTDKAYYSVDGKDVRIGFRRNGRIETALRLRFEELKRLYDSLPDEFDTADLRRLGDELNIKISPGFEGYIMRVFANYVKFGGDVLREGKTIRFLKDSRYLREENRKKMRQELEVIGTEV